MDKLTTLNVTELIASRGPALKTMRLFIVDGSRLLSAGLANLLGEVPGLEVVGQAQNLADAVREIRITTPDVVMLDVNLLGQSGMDLVNAVTKEEEGAPFVMMLAGNAPGFDVGPDILLYRAANIRSAVSILRNLVEHLRESDERGQDKKNPEIQ
jgi:DNA-binding NarL/FixJ family response regulator